MKFKSELLGSKLTYLREISVNDYCVIIEWLNDKKFNKLLYQGWETVTLEKFSKGVSMPDRPFTYGACIYDKNGIDQFEWLADRLKLKKETKKKS